MPNPEAEAAREIIAALSEIEEQIGDIAPAVGKLVALVGLLVEAHRAPIGWEYKYAETRTEANDLGAFGWRLKVYVPASVDRESIFLLERGLWDDGSGHRPTPNTEE